MMITKRKPFVRGMTPTWWQQLGFYKFYMFREASALTAVWFSIVLIYGAFSLDSPESFYGFVAFLQNPIVMLLNLLALVMAVVHTKTWFDLAPKAANIVVNDEKMGPKPIVTGLWIVTLVASLIILAVALM